MSGKHQEKKPVADKVLDYRSDMGIIQGLLDTAPAIDAFGHCVDVNGFISAVRDLRQLCINQTSTCEQVQKAWERVAYETGDSMMVCMLRKLDSWLWIPYANMDRVHRYRSHDDYTVVWVSDGKAVVGRSVRIDGKIRVRFTCQQEATP